MDDTQDEGACIMYEITLARRIGEVKWEIKKAEILIWTFVFGTIIPAILLCETITDKMYNLDLTYRASFFYALVALVFCYVVIVVYVLTRQVSDYFVAKTIGSLEPRLREGLMSLADSQSNLISTMIEERVDTNLKNLDYLSLFSRRAFATAGYFLAVIAVLLGFAILATGSNFFYHLARTAWPFAELAQADTTVIKNLTKTRQVVREGALLVETEIKPQKPAKVYLSYDKKEWFHLELVNNQAVIQNVRANFEYFIATDDAATGNFKIECIEGPSVKNIEFTVKPPAYTGRTAFTKSEFSVEAPQESHIKIRFTPDREITQSTFVYSNGHRDDGASSELICKSSISFHIELKDKQGSVGKTSEYVIKMIPDRPPQVSILSPEKESVIGPEDKFKPVVLVKDDYGLKWLAMYYQKKDEDEKKIDLPLKNGELFTFEFSPHQFGLRKDDSMIYYFEAADFYPNRKARATSGVNILHISDKPSANQSALNKLQEILKDDTKLGKLGIKEKVKVTGTKDEGPQRKINTQMEKLIDALMGLDEQILKEEQVEKKVLQELKEAAKFEKRELGEEMIVQEVKKLEEKGENNTGEFVKTKAYQLILAKADKIDDVLLLIESRVDKKFRRLVEAYFRNLARQE